MFTETERLILREFLADDFEDVHEYASDRETVEHMMFGPNTPEETREFLEGQCAREMAESPRMHFNFALEEKASGKIIGGVSLHLNWRRDDGIIGSVINRRYAGRGFMTEGLRGVFGYAFGVLGLHRIHGVCDVNNPAIIRVFEKLGMRNEGTMKKRGKARPEAKEPYFDQYGYAILKEEWDAQSRSDK